ncbi:MAG: hypothetical protein J6X54_02980 [Treponema sp.]|nr:hypothetical protein [Treponema sp.]
MIVISDTTPVIALIKINRLDLLEKLFTEVLIKKQQHPPERFTYPTGTCDVIILTLPMHSTLYSAHQTPPFNFAAK